MSATVKSMPGTFPLHEDRDFLRESEWVILKLLCRSLESLMESEAEELSEASGGQLSVERCRELIAIVRISRLPGLGSWMARLMVEAGMDYQDITTLPAGQISGQINAHMGYGICNPATTHALADLQKCWFQKTRQGNA